MSPRLGVSARDYFKAGVSDETTRARRAATPALLSALPPCAPVVRAASTVRRPAPAFAR